MQNLYVNKCLNFGEKYAFSQCSTLVRNTVVRATFKVNGKPPILGSRNPLTNRLNIWHGWLRRKYKPTCQKL